MITPVALLLLPALAAAPMRPALVPYSPDANAERAAIPDAYKWQLGPLFPDNAAFEAGLQAQAAARGRLSEFRGALKRPAQLAACLDHYFQTRLLSNKLTLYANLRFTSDQKSSSLRAMNDRALQAMNDFMADASFLRQEVLRLDDPAMKAALAREPKLAAYQPYLEEMRRRRARLLSADGERVLALAGDNLFAEQDLNELPSDFEKAFDAGLADLVLPSITDESGKPVQLTLNNYPKLRASTDRRVRRAAVEALLAALRSQQDLFAATLGGQVRFNVLLARARGYTTALEAYLDKDNVAPAVYRNLVSTVRTNVAPLRRYLALRQKLLGLPDLHLYDLYVPMAAKASRSFTFAQAREVLPRALAALGPDYVKVLSTGLDPASGWVDLYPHRNKQSGASCSSLYGVHPFVKMNYLDDLEGLSVLSHELGHALHSHLSMSTQPYPTANYTMFAAEIASTVNQKLLSGWMVKNARDDQERLYLLNKLAEEIRTTIYRQTLFAEFELALHSLAEKGEPLTADVMNKVYGDLLRAYYGPNLTVDADDALEWAYVPHFYYKYYVYVYATGLSAGIALAEGIESGAPERREAYLTMLRGGCSKPPLELLKGAGVDLTRPDAIVAATRLLDQTVAEMERLTASR